MPPHRVPIILSDRARILLPVGGEDLGRDIKAQFEHSNPQFHKLKNLGIPTWNEPAIIRTWKEEDGWLSVPRGGLMRVRQTFTMSGFQYAIEDRRTTGSQLVTEAWPVLTSDLSLYPYQKAAVEDCIAKQNCILRAPTGSGKTRMGYAIGQTLMLPTLVIVWSGALFDQWLERAHSELGLAPEFIGQIKGKKRKLRPFTVAMSQTLAKGVDQETRDYFGVVLFDEVQRAAANTMFNSVDPFPAKYRIGISADESRKDRKEFLTHDLFGGLGANIKRDQLIKSGHVLDVEIRCIPTDFEAPWYGVEEKEDNTDFLGDAGVLEEDANADPKVIDFDRLLKEMCVNEKRNQLALEAVLHHQAREQVLMVTHRREHCLALDQRLASVRCKTGFLIGGPDYVKEFRKTVAGLETGELRVGVGTLQAAGTGLDLPKVGIAVVATPIAGNRQFFGQVRGRVCRVAEGKERAILYYLLDMKVFGAKHLTNLMSWNPTVKVLHHGLFINARDYLLLKSA